MKYDCVNWALTVISLVHPHVWSGHSSVSILIFACLFQLKLKWNSRTAPTSLLCIGESHFECCRAAVSHRLDPQNHPSVLNSTSTSSPPALAGPPPPSSSSSSSSSDTSSWQLAPFNSLQHWLGLEITGVLHHGHHTCPLTGGTVPSGTSWGGISLKKKKRVSSVSLHLKTGQRCYENCRRRLQSISPVRLMLLESSHYQMCGGGNEKSNSDNNLCVHTWQAPSRHHGKSAYFLQTAMLL